MIDGLQALVDREEIREVLARYCRGIDRLDEQLIASTYHEDAFDDHGTYKGSGHDFAAYIVPALKKHTSATMHVLGQSTIDVQPFVAWSETYFVAYHSRIKDGQDFLDQFGGRYVDRLEKRDARWRIVHRVVVAEWTRTDALCRAHFSLAAFARGTRSAADISYLRDANTSSIER